MIRIGAVSSPSAPVYLGAGAPLRLKALIGMSPGRVDVQDALSAAGAAEAAGADAIQDVSIVGPLSEFTAVLARQSLVPVGSVLAYHVVQSLVEKPSQDARGLIRGVLARQADAGVAFVTVHASLSADLVGDEGRAIPIGSRAGRMLVSICGQLDIENPLRTYFDDIVEMLANAGMALSLGSSLRSCSVIDALDDSACLELAVQAQLAQRAASEGVPVLLEGLGHARIGDIERFAEHARALRADWILTALGPLPTDAALGSDDVAAAIGASWASKQGVSMVSVVTSAEHTKVPTADDTRRAIEALRIASHAAAIDQGLEPYLDRGITLARANRTWSCMHEWALGADIDVRDNCDGSGCGVCGEMCPLLHASSSGGLARIRPGAFLRELGRYPNELQNLWWRTLETLSQFEEYDVFSFGSLFSGDFQIKESEAGRLLLASDFEFSLLRRGGCDPGREYQLSTAIRSLNREVAPHHIGFHIGIGIDDEESFVARVLTSPWIGHLQTGRIVVGDTSVLNRLEDALGKRALPDAVEIGQTIDGAAWSLLIAWDRRLAPAEHTLRSAYHFDTLARVLCKTLVPIAARIGRQWPRTINEALLILSASGLLSAPLQEDLEHLNRVRIAMRPLPVESHRIVAQEALRVLGFFESLLPSARNTSPRRLLRQILTEIIQEGSISTETESARSREASIRLASRGGHYAYLKELYGIADDR